MVDTLPPVKPCGFRLGLDTQNSFERVIATVANDSRSMRAFFVDGV